ncbi:uncharacterized protein MELLADRAFT_106345 [Melampsora larici-populina 98AG31]|uniref:Secreted protein n=1 Tax=Melampsora larici-populina (strain 98AG31 / pathotype 3-4-7) TaxID=747676 RepID=F4RL33_MELLP|nr:uncharacterized protein MELLADRAFT_106345 [Melampsora larici-populina 98AG31]EGG06935.1 hypothetical protein MELLADRAFT_106345 [Melampsora larici-populina 98AG31]
MSSLSPFKPLLLLLPLPGLLSLTPPPPPPPPPVPPGLPPPPASRMYGLELSVDQIIGILRAMKDSTEVHSHNGQSNDETQMTWWRGIIFNLIERAIQDVSVSRIPTFDVAHSSGYSSAIFDLSDNLSDEDHRQLDLEEVGKIMHEHRCNFDQARLIRHN